MFESIGKIIYDPFRANMKNNTSNWCIIDCDKEITRYYRSWLKSEKHIILHQPSWDAHISVVSGQRIPDQFKHLWKKHHGKSVKFQYQHGNIESIDDKKQAGRFYWIRVNCSFATDLRGELGLQKYQTFHLTIGRTYW